MADQKVMGEDMKVSHDMPKDALQSIFDAQKGFGSKFCNFTLLSRREDKDDPPIKMSKYSAKEEEKPDNILKSRIHWHQVFLDCIEDELSEVRNWLPWKHWKTYNDFQLKATELKFELIDILHFIVSEYLLMGWNAKDTMQFLGMRERPNQTEFTEQVPDLNIAILIAKCDFMDSYLTDPKDLTDEQRVNITKKSIREIIMSVGEGYKDPMSGSVYKNIMKTLFKLFVVWGMSGQDVYDFYMSKNKENFDRQARGY